MRAARTISCSVWNLSSSPEVMIAPDLDVRSVVAMRLGQAEALGGAALGVELDQHRRVLADHPRVVAGLDHDRARGAEVERAAVRVLTAHPAAGQEAHVRVHAQGRVHDVLHVHRPARAGWVAHALDAAVGRRRGIDDDTADLSTIGAPHRGEPRIARGPRVRARAPGGGALGAGRFPRALHLHGGLLLARARTSETLTPGVGLVKPGTIGSLCRRCSMRAVWSSTSAAAAWSTGWTSSARRGRSWACSAPTAQARPRPSGCSTGSCVPTRAGSTSTASSWAAIWCGPSARSVCAPRTTRSTATSPSSRT